MAGINKNIILRQKTKKKRTLANVRQEIADRSKKQKYVNLFGLQRRWQAERIVNQDGSLIESHNERSWKPAANSKSETRSHLASPATAMELQQLMSRKPSRPTTRNKYCIKQCEEILLCIYNNA